MSFFASRWVEARRHVRELEDGLPLGLPGRGRRLRIKPSGGRDLGLLVSDREDTVSAARFTRSGVLAAPVIVCQDRCRLDALRAIVVNSGNANAATGGRGLDEAARMQGAGAMAAGVREDRVGIASTGVIGVQLDGQKVVTRPRAGARPRSTRAATSASPTRSGPRTFGPKRASLEVELPSGTVRLSAQAKGAGMISPSFATLLCFVRDGRRARARDGRPPARRVRQALLRPHLRRRPALHERLGVPARQRRQRREGRARVARRAALRRGARRAAAPARADDRRRRRGRRPGRAASSSRAATPTGSSGWRARSPTRRWSRPRSTAATRTGAGSPRPPARRCPAPRRCRSTSGSRACRSAPAGTGIPFDEGALAEAVSGPEIEYAVGLPGEGAEAEVFFSDLSHGYVTINAEYTT